MYQCRGRRADTVRANIAETTRRADDCNILKTLGGRDVPHDASIICAPATADSEQEDFRRPTPSIGLHQARYIERGDKSREHGATGAFLPFS